MSETRATLQKKIARHSIYCLGVLAAGTFGAPAYYLTENLPGPLSDQRQNPEQTEALYKTFKQNAADIAASKQAMELLGSEIIELKSNLYTPQKTDAKSLGEKTREYDRQSNKIDTDTDNLIKALLMTPALAETDVREIGQMVIDENFLTRWPNYTNFNHAVKNLDECQRSVITASISSPADDFNKVQTCVLETKSYIGLAGGTVGHAVLGFMGAFLLLGLTGSLDRGARMADKYDKLKPDPDEADKKKELNVKFVIKGTKPK